MAIKADFEMVVNGGVDETKTIFLVFGDGRFAVLATSSTCSGNHLSVDEAIVRGRRGATVVGAIEGILEDSGMIPLRDWVCSKVLVIVLSGRPMNDDRTYDTIAILSGVVRVYELCQFCI